MKRFIPKINTTLLLSSTILSFTIFMIRWYMDKEPTTWLLIIGLGLGLLTFLTQCMNIIFITVFAAKNAEIGCKENDRNKKYEFIKGLY